jgi:excisionase family DNA binding protein
LSRHESGGVRPLAVTVKKACELIGVGNTTMYELIRDGRVKTTTIGRRRG